MKLDKDIFKQHINYLNDLKDVVKIINKLHKRKDNGSLYSHSFWSKASYQFIYRIDANQPWELVKYYDDSDKPNDEYVAQTPEELWVKLSLAESEAEDESEGEEDE